MKKFNEYAEWSKRVKERGAVQFLPVTNGTVAQNARGSAIGLWNPNKNGPAKGEGVIYGA